MNIILVVIFKKITNKKHILYIPTVPENLQFFFGFNVIYWLFITTCATSSLCLWKPFNARSPPSMEVSEELLMVDLFLCFLCLFAVKPDKDNLR